MNQDRARRPRDANSGQLAQVPAPPKLPAGTAHLSPQGASYLYARAHSRMRVCQALSSADKELS